MHWRLLIKMKVKQLSLQQVINVTTCKDKTKILLLTFHTEMWPLPPIPVVTSHGYGHCPVAQGPSLVLNRLQCI